MASISTRLLLLWLLFVIIGTQAPFGQTAAEVHGPTAFAYGSHQQDPTDFALNLLLFVPLGVLLYSEGRLRSLTVVSIAFLAGTCGVLISTPLEYLQIFRLRDSSLIDVLANTCGALLGVAANKAWGSSVETHVNRWRAGMSSPTLPGLTAGFLSWTTLITRLRTRTGPNS
jgi:VanZ family protein